MTITDELAALPEFPKGTTFSMRAIRQATAINMIDAYEARLRLAVRLLGEWLVCCDLYGVLPVSGNNERGKTVESVHPGPQSLAVA